MTIIQPHKNSGKSKILTLFLLLGVFAAAGQSILFYNQLVDLRHEVKQAQQDLSQAEVTNAELKNNLYGLTDNKNLQSLLNGQSLILDNNPQYVKMTNSQQVTTND